MSESNKVKPGQTQPATTVRRSPAKNSPILSATAVTDTANEPQDDAFFIVPLEYLTLNETPEVRLHGQAFRTHSIRVKKRKFQAPEEEDEENLSPPSNIVIIGSDEVSCQPVGKKLTKKRLIAVSPKR